MNIELKEAHRKAEELSLQDSLTSLYNRRAIMKIVDYEIRRSRRVGIPLSALIIDIDHFKQINDTYGHEMGHRILQSLSTILTTEIRSPNIVSRWGGEEFVLITSDSSLEFAAVVGNKIRTAVEEHIFPQDISVTISLGVGQYSKSEDFQNFFRRIDAAL